MRATSPAQAHRHAVVTGASGKLGAALAQRLLDRDWHVDLWSRNTSARTDQLLARYPDRARWHEVDVTDPGTVKEALRECPLGARLELLVNNTGLLHQNLFVTEPDEITATTVDVNLLGLLYATKACARLMLGNGGGNIINVSSINAIRGNRGVAT